MFEKSAKKAVSLLAAIVMASSNVSPVYAEDFGTTDENDLTYQSLELYPNGEDAEQVVTLDGLMPEGAEATAVDVTDEHDGIAAYDITITNGRKEYQPGEENPILVEITDPVITEYVTLWHIPDDGEKEQILDFTAENGKVSFYATGFSVYEIADEGFDFNVSYPVVPVSGDTSFSVMSVDTVDPISDFTFSTESKTSPKLIEKITTIEQLESYDLTKTGFYLCGGPGESNNGVSKFATDAIGNTSRSGIVLTDTLKDKNNKNASDAAVNKHQLLYNAVETNNAVPFYFESTGTDHQYYIYSTSDKGVTKHYIKNNPNNSLKFATGKADATPYVIEQSTNSADSIKIRTANQLGGKYWYWNYRNGEGGPARFSGTDGSQYADKANNNIYIWYYALDHDLEEDPYDLNGKTYGLVSSDGYAITTVSNTSNELKGLQITSGEGAYSSPYAVTGWTFEWVEGTDKYKLSAYAENGAAKKYLQLASDGIHLVDEADASELTVTPNYDNGKIKLSLPLDNLSIQYNNKLFKKAGTDTADANRYLDLVNVPEASTDALDLDNKTYALINRNADNGYALLAAANGTTKLKAQTVTARTNDEGKTEYVFFGDLSQWTFHHIDHNRYTISSGTQYLKLVSGSLTVTDEPYILTVVAGTDENEGKIKIYNSTDNCELNRESTTSFSYTNSINANASKWLDLVIVPDPPATDPLGLDEQTYGIVGTNNSNHYAMLAQQNSTNTDRLDYTKLTLNSSGDYELSNSVISGWTFHWINKSNYKISDPSGKYIKADASGLTLVDDPDEASTLSAEVGTDDNEGKIKLYDAASNRYITCWNTFASSSSGSFLTLVSLENQTDPLELDGRSLGLMNYTGGTSGNAFVADVSKNCSKLYEITTRNVNAPTETRELFIPSESDITMWKFEAAGIGRYLLKTETGSYLKADGSDFTFVLSSDDATVFDVKPTTTAEGHTAIYLSNGNKYVSFSSDDQSSKFEMSNSPTPLCLVNKTDVGKDEEIIYSANRISVSDGERAYNGAELIVYTRIWDDKNKKYDFYAIDHDGSLKRCYPSGDKLMWKDDVMNTLLWKFTVYYDKGKENGYYELQNIYSGMYLAPQLPKNGQVMQEDTIGIQLPGRKYEKDGDVYTYGEYYSPIIAWDESHYDFAALRAEYQKNDTPSGNTIFSDFYSKADTFYFATLDSIDTSTSDLHEVKTLSNNDYGITMRVTDFSPNDTNVNSGSAESEITKNYFDNNTNNVKGLLSTNLDEDGHPTVQKGNVGKDFGDAFNNAIYTDKLFIESIHEESGYFEFDSCQNFATLVPEGNAITQKTDKNGDPLFLDENGNLTTTDTGRPIYDFTVYRELGTMESDKPTRKHGQFLPYNYIKPGEFSTVNKENLYDVLSVFDNPNIGILKDADPRKHEKLYTVFRKDENDNEIKQPDYYLGMEMEAKFVQTPSGLDAWGHDVIFDFTGDDDFWLYVDGELVIDLGGIHSALEGTVNFRTGEVNYTGIPANNKTLKDTFYNNYLGRTHTRSETLKYLKEQYGVGEFTKAEYQAWRPDEYQHEYDYFLNSTHTAAETDAYIQQYCTDNGIDYDEFRETDEYRTMYNDYYDSQHTEEETELHMEQYCRDIEPTAETYEKYKELHPDQINYDEEYNNYLNLTHTTAEAQAYVGSIFEQNENGQWVFKDYTEHTMKVYYMERGAGASNLHMRFNLSAVSPGNVLFSKKMTGAENSGIDFNAVQFPFQIQYKYTEDDENWRNLTNINSSDDKPSVSYQNSTQTVRYAETYRSPNANKEYQNVFFLIPGKSIEINFPDNAMYYRIIECAVDKTIYNVTVNEGEKGDAFEESSEGITVSSGSIKDLITKASQVSEQPTINFDNAVDPDNMRSLNITKHLYAGRNKAVQLTYEDDPTTFNYRVYLANATDEELTPANRREYYVLDPYLNLCEWDATQQKFKTYEPHTTVDAINTLSEEAKNKVVFRTSQYGSISKIPADYTVRIQGLVAGTRFLVEERDDEMPVGYDLLDFECKTGQFTDQSSQQIGIASYTVDRSYKVDGKEYYFEGAAPSEGAILKGSKFKNSAGTIKAGYQAEVIVNNYKGYGLKAEKQWTDEDFTESHGDIYAAVYVDGKAEPLQIKRIVSPNTTAQFFFDELEAGKSLDDYHIFEVIPADPVTNLNGSVTAYSSITKVSANEMISLQVTDSGSDGPITDEYTVTYPEATDAEAQKLAAQGNARKEMIRNTRKGGIEILLHPWNNTIAEDTPLKGGTFTLTRCVDVLDPETNETVTVTTVLGPFTSDSTGIVTVLYGISEGERYILEQTASPNSYIGMEQPIEFTITKDSNNVFGIYMSDQGNPNDTDNDTLHPSELDPEEPRDWAEYDSPSGVLAAKIDIYNKPFTLKILKVQSGTHDGLEGAEFALYRAVMLYGSLVKDYSPLPGYDSLITSNGDDGLERGQIPLIDNTLMPRKYYLCEKTPPTGFEGLSEDLIITITKKGQIEIEGAEQSGYLETIDSGDHSSVTYLISVPNEVGTHDYFFNIKKNILIDKNIHNSDPEQKFVFKVERFTETDTTMNAPEETFYVTLKCNTHEAAYPGTLPEFTGHEYHADTQTADITYGDGETYSFPAAVYSGKQTVKVTQKGIYKVTEVTDWSNTDYDFWTGSNIYTVTDSTKLVKHGTAAMDGNAPFVAFRITDPDTDKDNAGTASFTNTETEYAYLSSQAYAENTIKRN